MGGGAWPFLVGEVTCLVNSDNGRDFDLLPPEPIYLDFSLNADEFLKDTHRSSVGIVYSWDYDGI